MQTPKSDCDCLLGQYSFGAYGMHWMLAPKDYCWLARRLHDFGNGQYQCNGNCGSRKREDADCTYQGQWLFLEHCPLTIREQEKDYDGFEPIHSDQGRAPYPDYFNQ